MRIESDPSTAPIAFRSLIDEATACLHDTAERRARPKWGWESLTPREREVARLVTHGATNPDIGLKLNMTNNTVKTHLSHIFTKLGITSRAELAALFALIEYSTQPSIRSHQPPPDR